MRRRWLLGVDYSWCGLRDGCARERSTAVGCGCVGRSGGRACEAADTLQRFDEVGEERVAGREAQDEPSPAAADGGSDGDEAEAESFRVARALAFGQGEQFQPSEQVEGEQRAEQVGPVGVEAFAGQVVEAEPELGLLDLVFEVGLRAVPALELVG